MTAMPWLLGDGSKSVATAAQNQAYRFDVINNLLQAQGVTDQATFNALAAYLGFSGGGGGGSNKSGAGAPGGGLTPDFTGQYYRDATTGNIWVANSTTPGDWSLLLQDMQVAWTPTNLKLGELLGIYADTDNGCDLAGLTDLVFREATFGNGFRLNGAPNLISVAFPNLVSVTGYQPSFDSLILSNNTNLTSVSAPLLATLEASMSFSGDTSLASISLPSFVIGWDLDCSGCSALASVSLPLWTPDNGTANKFVGCALDAASVNHLLARCVASAGFVSGIIDTHGGTSDAPTGQGIIDKATLNARQAGLAVTN